MKSKTNIISLFTIILSSSFINENAFLFPNKKISSLNNYLLKYTSTDSKVTNIKEVIFNNEICYFIDLKSSTKKYSLLTENSLTNPKVLAIFEDESKHYEYFLDFKTVNNPLKKKIKTSSYIYYDYFGVTYSDESYTKDNYFKINNLDNTLYTYSSSYLNEIKITNVPNYMNTMFDNNGCVPTAAAMYFAYLEDNNINNICNNLNLPLKHTFDTNKVNNYIYDLGANYFYTTIDGTLPKNIASGYIKYLNDHNLSNYTLDVSKNYSDFLYSIKNCALPVPTSLKFYNQNNALCYHSALGIGIKSIFNKSKNDDFIIFNFAWSNKMEEFALTVDFIRQFYFIHK